MCKMNILKALGIPVSTAQPIASPCLSFHMPPKQEESIFPGLSTSPCWHHPMTSVFKYSFHLRCVWPQHPPFVSQGRCCLHSSQASLQGQVRCRGGTIYQLSTNDLSGCRTALSSRRSTCHSWGACRFLICRHSVGSIPSHPWEEGTKNAAQSVC